MAEKLQKQLGLIDVFAICIGAMISSGLFVLPGIAAAKAGPAVIAAYLLSGLFIVPSMFSLAEMATALPRAGGTCFFVSRSLGGMFGTIDGVGVWLALILKTSIALLGFGAYLAVYIDLPVQAIALVAGLIFMGTNMVGSKETSRLQVVMVAGLIGILVFLVGKGIPAVDRAQYAPFAPYGLGAVLPTAALVFISYIGLTKVASVAEEVKNPGRNIPLAFATTANAGIMSASRYLLAMSRDRIIPHAFSRSSRFKTPLNAIVLTSAVMLVIVSLAGIERIAKLASTFQLLVFAFVNISVIVMRESGIQSYDPAFKSPLYPYIQIVGILISVVLIPEMGLLSSVFAMGLVAVGVVWHYLYVRPRVEPRVGAVAKMAERLGERLLERDADVMGLRNELREIMKERGLREDDPFLQMVRAADFIEVEPGVDSEELIRRGATLLAKQSGISRDLIFGALLERNRMGETPADAGVALPHLLLNDAEEAHMVAFRSICGIDFPLAKQNIHAVFMMLGSRKNPSQHLRFLAEIARRAENLQFIDSWIVADSVRDVADVLLSVPE